MEVTNNLQTIVKEKYYTDGNRYYFTRKLNLFPFTNFVVHSVRRLISVDEQNHEHEQFVIQLKNIDGRIIEIEFLSSDLRRLPLVITEKSYGFHIATDEFGKKAWEMFNVVMSEILFQLDTSGRIFTQKNIFKPNGLKRNQTVCGYLCTEEWQIVNLKRHYYRHTTI